MVRICKKLLVLAGVTTMFTLSLLAAHRRIGGANPPSPVLGTGHGIDHVVVLVRDFEDAERVYRDVLGFRVAPGGAFPGGVRNSGVLFETDYLELATVDPSRVDG